MKRTRMFFAILLAAISMLALQSCGYMDQPRHNTMITIYRSVDFAADPYIAISGDNISFSYDERQVVVWGSFNIAGSKGSKGAESDHAWIFSEAVVSGDKVIFKIPNDHRYEIEITHGREKEMTRHKLP